MGSSASASKKNEPIAVNVAPAAPQAAPKSPVVKQSEPIATSSNSVPEDQVQSANNKNKELAQTNNSNNSPSRSNRNVQEEEPVDHSNAVAYNPNSDEIVFETFHHRNGISYCCMYSNGIRYYLDSFESGQWLEFPLGWYNEGVLETDEIHSGGSAAVAPAEQQQQQMNAAATESQEIRAALMTKTDDREGVIQISGRETYQTYVFEHRRNIHCFYDTKEGAWIKLPIKWELKTNLAKRLISKVKEIVPQWKDEGDILASLRVSNYNVDDCINTYHVTIGANDNDKISTSSADRAKSPSRNEDFNELEVKHKSALQRIKALEEELQKEKTEKEYLSVKVTKYEEQMATHQAQYEAATMQLQTIQKSRPKSAAPNKMTSILMEGLTNIQESLSEMKAVQIQNKSEIDELKLVTVTTIKDIQTKAGLITLQLQKSGDQLDEYKTLYRREALQRKLLYNQLQELRGNIRVFCRVRKDPNVGTNASAVACIGDSLVEINTGGQRRSFEFDHAFGPNSSQSEVFAEVQPIIISCADGYNICILAYGQTGSGKTHTMQGPQQDPGVNVRAVKELLRLCDERKENITYELMLSMVEIYNENIQDLLSPKVDVVELKAQGQKVFIAGLTEKQVKTEEDIFNIIKLGESNRKVASTKMNSTSSRSHLLVILSVIGKDKITDVTTRGQLTMCDLAGSERVSKTEAQGARLTEAAFINKSLSALGQVFTALRMNQQHVPYRNSKLTHILQPSLGGDAKACLFVNVSPDASNSSESLSTVQFGGNARQVALGQAKKNIEKAPVK